MNIVNKNDLPPPPVPIKDKRLNSPSVKQNGIIAPPPPREVSPMPRPNGIISKKKPFNFARIADSIDVNRGRKSPELSEVADDEMTQESKPPSKPAFLRPTSLPLKPGTFTPKQHHGITPTANTLPLISPETPRPSKSCVQLYLNGHAYTYLGLKSSTKPFYCTVNKPQPTYIQNQHKLSMYSNWQIYNGNNPNILDLSPYAAMSLYDSRQRPNKFAIAEDKKELVKLVESQSVRLTVAIAPTNYQIQQVTIKDEQSPGNNNAINLAPPPSSTASIMAFESNEEYTYIRGRGRGKYICQECGIRCKKPSMLKKHIRTHTDLRPYTCSYCEFR
jgi:HIV type I enhancer-binding protein